MKLIERDKCIFQHFQGKIRKKLELCLPFLWIAADSNDDIWTNSMTTRQSGNVDEKSNIGQHAFTPGSPSAYRMVVHAIIGSVC